MIQLWGLIAIGFVLQVLSYVLAPKPPERQRDRGDPVRQFDAPTADVGRPMPVVFGTVVVKSLNVLHYTDKLGVAIEDNSRAEYYMSLHYGICVGQIDSIRRIRLREKTLLVDAPKTHDVDATDFHGGADKEGGVKGRVLWTDGSMTQVMPADIAELYGETSTSMPGYRGLATLCFRHAPGAGHSGFLWGQSPYIPAADVMLTRVVNVQPGWFDSVRTISPSSRDRQQVLDTQTVDPDGDVDTATWSVGPDCNPVHIVRECLTDRVWGGSVPAHILDDASFRAAASTLYAEGFGLSFQFDAQESIGSMVREVMTHVDALLYASPVTGLFQFKLLRHDYDAANLDVYDESDSSVSKVVRKSVSELANEIVLKFTDPEEDGPNQVSLQNIAAIVKAGVVISSSRNMRGIRNIDTAWRVAERELVGASEETLALEMEIDRRGYDLVPGSVIRVTSESNGLDRHIVRVISVDYGRPDDDVIKLNCIDDVFSRTTPNFETPTSGGRPSNPRRFGLTAGDGEVTLSWLPPADDGGSPILGYQYQMNGGDWLDAGNADARSFTVTGLTNGTTYTFRVRAYNAAGPGTPSVSLRVGPDPVVPTVPTPPTNYRVVPVGAELEQRWAEPENDGHSTIVRYEYEIDENGVWIVVPEGHDFLHRIVGLTVNQQYRLRLRAVNAIGDGAPTSVVHVTLRDPESPAYEHPPRATGLFGRGGIEIVALFWGNPLAKYQNHASTIVYRHDSDDFSSATQIGKSNTTSFVDEFKDLPEDQSPAGSWYYWIAWQSQSSVIGDPSTADPDEDAAGLLIEVKEDPAAVILRLSQEILDDPVVPQLLAPIGTSEFDRLTSPPQAVAKELVEGYVRVLGLLMDAERNVNVAARLALTERLRKSEEALAAVISQVRASLGDVVDTLTFQTGASDKNAFETLLTVGTVMRAGVADDLGDYEVVTVEQDDTKFTVQVKPKADATWPTAGTLAVQPAGFNAPVSFPTLELAADDIDAAGEWHVTIGDATQGVALAQEILEARVTLIEDLDGNTKVAALARWEVKTQVGDLVGGVGLYNDGNKTRFYIAADRFAIIPSATNPDDEDAVLPFFVENGKVYLNMAVIAEASIGVAYIGDAFLTNLTAVHGVLNFARIDKGNIFDLTISNRIGSDNSVPGQTGWFIDRAGYAEFDAATIRGVLQAEHISADVQNVLVLWEGNNFQDHSFAAYVFSGLAPGEKWWERFDFLDVQVVTYDGHSGLCRVEVGLIPDDVYVSQPGWVTGYRGPTVQSAADIGTVSIFSYVGGPGDNDRVFLRVWKRSANSAWFHSAGTKASIRSVTGISQPGTVIAHDPDNPDVLPLEVELDVKGTVTLATSEQLPGIMATVSGGSGTPVYDWQLRGLNASQFASTGVTDDIYVNQVFNRPGIRTLRCKVTKGNQVAYSDELTIVVVGAQTGRITAVITAAGFTRLNAGGTFAGASCVVTGGEGAISYDWQLHGVSASGFSSTGRTGASYGPQTFLKAGIRRLRCVVRRGNLTAISNIITINVGSVALSATLSRSGTIDLVRGSPLPTISCTVTGGFGAITYRWELYGLGGQYGDTGLRGSSYTNQIFNKAGTRYLRCRVTRGDSTVLSNVVTIVVT